MTPDLGLLLFDLRAEGHPIARAIGGDRRDVEPGDDGAMAAALRDLRGDPTHAAALGQNARICVAEPYSRMDHAEAFERLGAGLAGAR
jgi:hypothetical protein